MIAAQGEVSRVVMLLIWSEQACRGSVASVTNMIPADRQDLARSGSSKQPLLKLSITTHAWLQIVGYEAHAVISGSLYVDGRTALSTHQPCSFVV